MLPELIIHNSVSLDGSLSGFSADIELHYKILRSLDPDAMLIGSNTAKTGAEMFAGTIPAEEPSDLVKPPQANGNSRPYWIIADSRGILEGILHVFRRSEYCQDVIVLVSERSPASYIQYLRQRNLGYIATGTEHVDYRRALERCNERYGFRRIITNCGSTLCGVLLDQGLVNMISLVITPAITGKESGKESTGLFRKAGKPCLNLELLRQEVFSGGHLHVLYRVPEE